MTTPIVLVHGNPETPAVWDLLVARLRERGYDEPVRLAPPGFGAPVPPGFDPHPLSYRDWLVEQLEAVGRPVDLVGHDWGGLHVGLVAMHRPDLLRSWASDSVGALAPDYTWHPLARIWQTPGDGEAWVRDQLTVTGPTRHEAYVAMGMRDLGIAARVADGFDAQMGEVILRLYRAAAQPVMAELGRRLPDAAQRPGLVLLATADGDVGTRQQRLDVAARAGATVAELTGAGHWWMTQDGARPGADALARFWEGLR